MTWPGTAATISAAVAGIALVTGLVGGAHCTRYLAFRRGGRRSHDNSRRLSAFLRMLLKRHRILAAAQCLGRRPRSRSGAATASAPSRRLHGGVLGAARTDTSRRRSAATAVRLCLPRFHRTRGRLIGTHCLSSMRELAARIYSSDGDEWSWTHGRGVANAYQEVRPFCCLPVFRAGTGWSRRTDANKSGQRRTDKGCSS